MITTDPDGQVQFKVFLPHAASVEIAGDFTDWHRGRIPLRRVYPGWWVGSVAIEPGEHSFVYIVDGAIQLADYAAHGVRMDDGGRWISSLQVYPSIFRELAPADHALPAGTH